MELASYGQQVLFWLIFIIPKVFKWFAWMILNNRRLFVANHAYASIVIVYIFALILLRGTDVAFWYINNC